MIAIILKFKYIGVYRLKPLLKNVANPFNSENDLLLNPGYRSQETSHGAIHVFRFSVIIQICRTQRHSWENLYSYSPGLYLIIPFFSFRFFFFFFFVDLEGNLHTASDDLQNPSNPVSQLHLYTNLVYIKDERSKNKCCTVYTVLISSIICPK